MEILVITGGIGSGKSEVCRILARKGLNAQYNADAKVKELAEKMKKTNRRLQSSSSFCFMRIISFFSGFYSSLSSSGKLPRSEKIIIKSLKIHFKDY